MSWKAVITVSSVIKMGTRAYGLTMPGIRLISVPPAINLKKLRRLLLLPPLQQPYPMRWMGVMTVCSVTRVAAWRCPMTMPGGTVKRALPAINRDSRVVRMPCALA